MNTTTPNKQIHREAKGGIKATGRYRFITYKAGTKEVLRVSPYTENLVMNGADTGIQIIAQHLAQDFTNQLFIDTASIGTGDTAPTIADTGLQTSVLSGITRTEFVALGAVVTLDFFITDAQLANGTYKEFGLFSGSNLFARSLIVPVFTKASGEDVTIEYIITLSTV